MNQRIVTFLGFAQKAGKLVSGDSAGRAMLQQGKAHLVIIAEDASQRTNREFSSLAEQAGIPSMVVGTKVEIGSCIGQSPRSVVVIKDKGFAKTLLDSYHD